MLPGLQAFDLALAENSPLRLADPRSKLLLSVCISLIVMSPLPGVLTGLALFAALAGWARLLRRAARQVWRLKFFLAVLFVVDWLVVSPSLAVIVTLRLILLLAAFVLFFATTTPAELALALEWMHVPYRYAFSVGLAFQSLAFIDAEWRTVREAQRARGAWPAAAAPEDDRDEPAGERQKWGTLRNPLPMVSRAGWRRLLGQARDLVALAVPAIVLTTNRAWMVTEAASARGFDSPRRRPFRRLSMGRLDWLIVGGALVIILLLVVYRFTPLWSWRLEVLP